MQMLESIDVIQQTILKLRVNFLTQDFQYAHFREQDFSAAFKNLDVEIR